MRLIIKDDDSVQVELDQPGGGNPNYIETIEGTLSDPWGDLEFASIVNAIISKNVTVYISCTAYGLTMELPAIEHLEAPSRYGLTGSFCNYTGLSVEGGLQVVYTSSGVLNTFKLTMDGETYDLLEDASSFSTVTTIIHHPLPENSNNEEE